ncbi:MAG TPA: preprotein translocase subunit YajC [Gaiellaceae bacterium]|jgi:preprotein translocase subunit YajC
MGGSGLLIVIILFGAVWLLFLMPARRRRAQHEAMQDSVGAGDEIITAGGLHGVVKEIDEGLAKVEIAPSVVVTLDRRAIAAVATEIEVEPGEAEHEDPAPGTGVEPR